MIQKPKGTLDLYERDGYTYNYICNFIHNFIETYNYNYVKIPTFESTELFYRGVGDTTDIVNKETYDFLDKGERKMTLRPEFTAGVVRCLLENKLYATNNINKFYYIGSCFRYERPQSGRLREFTQFGVETFGSNSPEMDAEIISIAYNLINALGIKNLKVKINSLGDTDSRIEYKKVLLDYLKKDEENLCEICKERLEKNPLRILDCKYDSDREYIKNAPKTIDYLNESSKTFFDKVLNCLTELNIPYEIDTSLVRGLDYYTHTVFEIVSDLKSLGPASTICGGGRYDNLVETLGGVKCPGIGFAMGLERIMTIINAEEINIPTKQLDAYIMKLTDTFYANTLCDEIRNSGFTCEIDYEGKNMKSQWKLVEKFNPTYTIIVGEDEEKGNYLTVKDNLTKESTQVKRDDILDFLNMNI